MTLPAPRYLTVAEPSHPAIPRHLAYYEYGSGPNVIICAHGLSRNGQDFELLAQSLSGKYRVICPDMAGRGNSDWLTDKANYNYMTYILDVLALLKQLEIPQVDWVGTSMGGIMGMMLAAQQPLLIKRLVLNDVGSVVSSEGLKRIAGYVGTSKPFATREEATVYMHSTFASFGLSSDEEWQRMFETTFKQLADGTYSVRYDPDINKPFLEAIGKGPITDVDLSAFWNAIFCPTLLLRGAESDILRRETAVRMQQSRPQVTLVEFPGIGHAPALFNAQQVKVITDWLDIKP